MAFLLDGKPLAVNVPFTVGGINYPANWLRLTTKAETHQHMIHVFIGVMELLKTWMTKQKLKMELK